MPSLSRALVERRLRRVGDRLRALRDELAVIDEQLAHLRDDADEADVRVLLGDDPFAGRENRSARSHAEAMARHRAHVVASIADLERDLDELLDRLGG